MGRLYTIVYVNKAELRDNLIDQLLGEEEPNTDVTYYFYNKNGKLQKNIDYKIKAYKTLRGAQREATKVSRLKAGRTIKATYGFYDENNSKDDEKNKILLQFLKDKRWSYDIKFEPSQHSLVVIDVTDRWNEMIDRDIEKRKIAFELDLQKLQQKKV